MKRMSTIAGISISNGNPQIRVTSSMTRVKNLSTECDDMIMIELPEPMLKLDAVRYLLTVEELNEYHDVIEAYIAEKAPSVASVTSPAPAYIAPVVVYESDESNIADQYYYDNDYDDYDPYEEKGHNFEEFEY